MSKRQVRCQKWPASDDPNQSLMVLAPPEHARPHTTLPAYAPAEARSTGEHQFWNVASRLSGCSERLEVHRDGVRERMPSGRWTGFCCGLALLALLSTPAALAQYPSTSEVFKDGAAVLLEDYASLPLSGQKKAGPYPGPVVMSEQLGRVTSIESEPADAPRSAQRFFVVDQNGIFYILDKGRKTFTRYIDVGNVFSNLVDDPVYGLGLVALVFDPGYTQNGKFYSVHTETPGPAASAPPSNASLPTLDLRGYSVTDAINSPLGDIGYHSILVEWTDTNIRNDTFEGSARELLRAGLNFALHPMAGMIFNPLARPGHPDYGNLYIGVGDGTAGDRTGLTHPVPQRLDALPGKILRITPDLKLRPNDMLSSNGRYRIPSTGPDPNPFVSVKSARPEVFAYGLRNPLKLSWDAETNTLIAPDIGNHSWEEINIITKGTNYGWADREGPEMHFVGGANGGKTGSQVTPPVPLPSPDTLVVDGFEKPVTIAYPVARTTHNDSLAFGGGFVYRGKLMPQLIGKYILTDIPTGRFFYADLAEMRAAGRVAETVAPIHELQIVYKDPFDASAKKPVKRRMYDIVADGFAHKGGKVPNQVLPGGSSLTGGSRTGAPTQTRIDPYGVPYGKGRADVRLGVGGDGEIYVMSKADGVIRKLVSVVPVLPQPASQPRVVPDTRD